MRASPEEELHILRAMGVRDGETIPGMTFAAHILDNERVVPLTGAQLDEIRRATREPPPPPPETISFERARAMLDEGRELPAGARVRRASTNDPRDLGSFTSKVIPFLLSVGPPTEIRLVWGTSY